MSTETKRRFSSWLWPDRAIGKAESRRLREEHNALNNSHAELVETSAELLRVIDALGELNVLIDWPVVRETLPPLRQAVRNAVG